MRDLNDLSFYAAVVASGGFSAAARELRVPKSRISRRVAALESRLGVRLLERSTRRFAVTEVGQDVYRHARAVLAEADAIDDVAARLKAEPQGLVRVSCPQGADRLVANALPAFLLRHPRLRVQLIVSNRRVDLIEEGVDVAIRVRERLDTDADLQVRIIGRSGSMLVASPAFLAEHGRPAAPADIASLPTLAQSERMGIERWTLLGPGGAEAVVAHEPRLSSGEFAVLREAALAGLGVALLPEYAAREPLADGRLEHLLPDWGAPQGILHVVFTSRRGLLPGVRAVIDFIAEVLDPKSVEWLNPT
ncbi:MAG TPA: LysR substrate-binding domain-containing protein [Caulobacteraceae bacterium]|nr:LysR substrate-binding domain-containing protein [Caulobacteraceae bacterium]